VLVVVSRRPILRGWVAAQDKHVIPPLGASRSSGMPLAKGREADLLTLLLGQKMRS
jgi:hypothetical protein